MEKLLTEQVKIITEGIFERYEEMVKSNIKLTEEKLETNSQMIE